jgi:hypothetical protein
VCGRDEERLDTNRGINDEARSPTRWLISHTKVLLDAVGTRSWLAHKMRGCGFAALDLHKAFGTDSLIATTRTVDIGWIIL